MERHSSTYLSLLLGVGVKLGERFLARLSHGLGGEKKRKTLDPRGLVRTHSVQGLERLLFRATPTLVATLL